MHDIFSESPKHLAESKRLLDEAMKAGFIEVIIIVCVVLGQPGVGKTCINYLLLDQRSTTVSSKQHHLCRNTTESRVFM
jgi:putative ribosome biogenesis GTPase RsgA